MREGHAAARGKLRAWPTSRDHDRGCPGIGRNSDDRPRSGRTPDRDSGLNSAHSGGADFSVSRDERHAEDNGRRGDNTIRHVGNVGTSDLVDAVGNAGIYRNDLEAGILNLACPSNTLRSAGPNPVLLLEVDDSIIEIADTRMGKPAPIAPSSASRAADERRFSSKRYQSKAWVSAKPGRSRQVLAREPGPELATHLVDLVI